MMPPPRFASLSLPEPTYDTLQLLKRELLRRGLDSVPESLRAKVFGREANGKAKNPPRSLTNGQVVELALGALESVARK